MRMLRYVVLDVFCSPGADAPFSGNPLAVFPEADGLKGAQMQALAQELNLSETCFCLPQDTASTDEQGMRVRIFTTQEELSFAGHPTLGTATALRLLPGDWHGRDEVRLQPPVGTIAVRFEDPVPLTADGSELPFGEPVAGHMSQRLPVFGALHRPAEVAPLLGLSPAALDPSKPIQTVSTGIPFVIVPLRSVETLAELRVKAADAAAYLRHTGAGGGSGDGALFFYVLAPESGDGTQWRARMQFYGGEDPATGSAAGCATAYLVHHGYAPAGVPLRIRQGLEMGRPSEIETSAWLEEFPFGKRSEAGGDPRYVRVGGRTILVEQGQLFLRGYTPLCTSPHPQSTGL